MRGSLLGVAGSAALVMVACGGPSDPPAAPAGFFPSGFEAGPLVSSATMVKSSAVGPHTTSFHFHVSVPRDEAFVVVVRCDTGKATVEAGGLTGGPCEGKPTGFTNGECGGYHASLTISVSRPQRGAWGAALYAGKTPDPNCHLQ